MTKTKLVETKTNLMEIIKNKEKREKIMQNKKMMTTIGILMLAVGIIFAFISNFVLNSGYESISNILNIWAQVFVFIFIGIFAWIFFALDKEFTDKVNKKIKKV